METLRDVHETLVELDKQYVHERNNVFARMAEIVENCLHKRQQTAEREAINCPKVIMVMKPVDGGRAVIGMIECPHCGKEHLTTDIRCGEHKLFCGTGAESPDGYSRVSVETIV